MTENNNDRASRQEVLITGIKIPFWDVVDILIWWALAAIPAGLILAMFYAAIAFMLIPMLGDLL